MFKNYLKIALRNIKKHKGYSFINIAGLAFGMACFLLIVFYIQFERSYDNFHEKGRNIYQVVRENRWEDDVELKSITGAPLAPLLLQEFPAIVYAVRFSNFGGEWVSHGEKRFNEKRFFFADESIFSVFTFPLVQGNPGAALEEPFSVVITQKTARRYFGDDDPINKILNYNLGGKNFDFKITGVIDEIPKNSHIDFDFIASYKSLRTITGEWFLTKHWDSPTWTYILLQEGYSPETLERLLPAFTEKYVDKWSFSSVNHMLQPLKDIYFHSPGPPIGNRGNVQFLFVLSVVAAFILLIACVNFMNLSTARSASRSKEIGMRKVIGAQRAQLIRQFVGESLVYSFFALILAIVLIELFLPTFNSFVGKKLSINYLNNIGYLVAMMLTAAIVGVISGSYPAFFLSSFKPVIVLKGATQRGHSAERVRKILVIGQFAISIALIASSVLIYKQMHFLKNKEIGFNKNNVIAIPIRDRSVRGRYELLKNRLLQNSNITGVTASSMEPGVTSQNGISMKARNIDDIDMGIIYVDHDYVKTLEINLTKGRDFSKDVSTDAKSALLMNQAALERLGWQDALGEEIELYFKLERIVPMYQTTLVGVIQNYNFRDLTTPMQPILLKIDPQRFRYILIRINGDYTTDSINYIKRIWKESQFDDPFEFSFLDKDMENVYRNHESFATIIRYATSLAIFIACLGLFGLASSTVEKRTKEIGIRKVLGATVPSLVRLISIEFLILVALSNIIAWPLAYYATNRWLQHFAYRIGISLWPFILSAVLALVVALITVIYQSVKTALANPVEALRYE